MKPKRNMGRRNTFCPKLVGIGMKPKRNMGRRNTKTQGRVKRNTINTKKKQWA
jgi:hypothetical protein